MNSLSNFKSIYSNYNELFSHLPSKRVRHFYILIFMSFVCSFAELLSLGSIVPFVTVLLQPDKLYTLGYIQPFIEILNIKESSQLLMPITIIFASFAFTAGLLRLLLLWLIMVISNKITADLTKKIYVSTLTKPYKYFIDLDSNEVISGVTQKSQLVSVVILASMNAVSSLIIISVILMMLIYANPTISLITFLFFGFLYVLLTYLTKSFLLRNSIVIANSMTKIVKNIQESIGSIRDIILNKSHGAYIEEYSKTVDDFRFKVTQNEFVTQSPKLILETFAIVLISILILIFSNNTKNISELLPIFALIIFGGVRLLPIMQQLYASLSSIYANKASTDDIIVLLRGTKDVLIETEDNDFKFKNIIELKNVFFKYSSNENWAIENVNISIKKGTKNAIIGETGSGKTTLVDILLGFLKPQKGLVTIDGEELKSQLIANWQNNIAHVPQNIFLSNASIAENIALVPKNEIDYEKLETVAKKARLLNFINTRNERFNEYVGERGIKISGGQLQRIGIARALYKGAEVIFLDESTSALDFDTENEIINALNEMDNNVTIIMITHRENNLDKFENIYEIKDNKVSKFILGKK